VEAKWFELNDKAPAQVEFCLQDIGIMTGFNPKLEVFPQARPLMSGDSHCTYRVEDHGGE